MTINYSKISQEFVKIIDILYAVIIGLGIVKIFDALGLPYEFKKFFSTEFIIFIFAIFIIVRDWITYHNRITSMPHMGFKRFILDIIILILFASLISSFKDPKVFYNVLSVYFAVLMIWQFLELREYSNAGTRINEAKRELKWNIYLFTCSLLFPLYVSFTRCIQERLSDKLMVILSIIFFWEFMILKGEIHMQKIDTKEK